MKQRIKNKDADRRFSKILFKNKIKCDDRRDSKY
jgi:hypothetical protein